MERTLKSMVDKGKKVHFTFYREGQLYYETDCGFQFSVPIADTAGAVFLAEDKALLFMRYIRREQEMIKKAKEEQEANNAAKSDN